MFFKSKKSRFLYLTYTGVAIRTLSLITQPYNTTPERETGTPHINNTCKFSVH